MLQAACGDLRAPLPRSYYNYIASSGHSTRTPIMKFVELQNSLLIRFNTPARVSCTRVVEKRQKKKKKNWKFRRAIKYYNVSARSYRFVREKKSSSSSWFSPSCGRGEYCTLGVSMDYCNFLLFFFFPFYETCRLSGIVRLFIFQIICKTDKIAFLSRPVFNYRALYDESLRFRAASETTRQSRAPISKYAIVPQEFRLFYRD